ncbi:flavonol sulfotransferase-like [Pyrus ussuriensis x Pyrus communis]|uniref:Sulfotransferase n=1 Tax=Pyrus ussuriensis x Pyrus communis TaxID=2448454 RepID=A0A5N5H924_9ROSA|nr:flavonol sulfotransferase-like [Pyrus ussuriensis x Pyrus communis]
MYHPMTFELFCQGVADYGPFWDHVLGFWKARIGTMKQEPVFYVKRLAEFVGQPFSAEEESEGVVDQIIKLCSQIGDWKHHFTDEMAKRVDHITGEKIKGSGLTFG